MSHLMKRADGHLAKRSSGHLARCAGCNNCDPAIPCRIKAVGSGLAGAFAYANGEHMLDYVGTCYWQGSGQAAGMTLRWYAGFWHVQVAAGIGCGGSLVLPGTPNTPCEPRGAYNVFEECDDWGCADEDSCAESIGGSITISYY